MAEDRKCTAHRTNGEPCGAYAIRGGTVCRVHGGSIPSVKAKAQERLERDKLITLMHAYGLRRDIGPEEALLEEVQYTAGHVAWLREQVAALEPAAMVWGVTEEAERGASEFPGTDVTRSARPSVWLDLYQRERTHLVNVCKAAISAGIEERRVRIAESQGALVAEVIRRILGRLVLTAEQEQLVPVVVPAELRRLALPEAV